MNVKILLMTKVRLKDQQPAKHLRHCYLHTYTLVPIEAFNIVFCEEDVMVYKVIYKVVEHNVAFQSLMKIKAEAHSFS